MSYHKIGNINNLEVVIMRSISIAVIGPSGIGKSTFIASLCEEKTKNVLTSRTTFNKGLRGQTKIAIYYNFVMDESILNDKPCVNAVFFYSEYLKGLSKSAVDKIGDKDKKILRNILNELNISESSFDESAQSMITEVRCNIPLSDIERLDRSEYAKFMHHVQVNVKASAELHDILVNKHIDSFIMRDVRGFGDNTKEQLEDLSTLSDNSKNSDELPDTLERVRSAYGLEGANSILFFVSSDVGLFTENMYNAYKAILRNTLFLNPIFIVSKNESMRNIWEDNINITYENIMMDNRVNRGMQDNPVSDMIEEICQECSKQYQRVQTIDAYVKLKSKYIKYLCLAKVAREDAGASDVYQKSVNGCVENIICNMIDYFTALSKVYDSSHFINRLIPVYRGVPEKVINIIRDTEFISCLLNNVDYMNMLGEEGGITTMVAGQEVGYRVIPVMQQMFSYLDNLIYDIKWKYIQDDSNALLCAIAYDKLRSNEYMDECRTVQPAISRWKIGAAYRKTQEYLRKPLDAVLQGQTQEDAATRVFVCQVVTQFLESLHLSKN